MQSEKVHSVPRNVDAKRGAGKKEVVAAVSLYARQPYNGGITAIKETKGSYRKTLARAYRLSVFNKIFKDYLLK